MTSPQRSDRGFTVVEVARYFRVSPEKVRNWIRKGELAAINTTGVLCAKPRFIILPHHLAAFEKARSAGPPPRKPARKRSTKDEIDFYPD